MTEDRLDRLGPIMNAIGVEGATIVGGDPDGLYIYGEADDGVVHAGVFRDEGETVRYFDPTRELNRLISDAWQAESRDRTKRWAVIEYEVRDTKFDVQFTYRGELDREESLTERREAALRRRYGDKPVIYPPMPGHLERARHR